MSRFDDFHAALAAWHKDVDGLLSSGEVPPPVLKAVMLRTINFVFGGLLDMPVEQQRAMFDGQSATDGGPNPDYVAPEVEQPITAAEQEASDAAHGYDAAAGGAPTPNVDAALDAPETAGELRARLVAAGDLPADPVPVDEPAMVGLADEPVTTAENTPDNADAEAAARMASFDQNSQPGEDATAGAPGTDEAAGVRGDTAPAADPAVLGVEVATTE